LISATKVRNKNENKYNNKEILYEQENHHHHSARPRRNGGAGQIHPKNFKIHPLLTDFTEKEAEKRQQIENISEKCPSKQRFSYKNATIMKICGNFVPTFKKTVWQKSRIHISCQPV
jgi:hypothetical protein